MEVTLLGVAGVMIAAFIYWYYVGRYAFRKSKAQKPKAFRETPEMEAFHQFVDGEFAVSDPSLVIDREEKEHREKGLGAHTSDARAWGIRV